MYRNHSRPSPSTSPSTPPRSSTTPELDMPGRASTTTSLYSDDPTEVPPLPTTYGYNVREGKLIDYDEDEGKVINPTDKLRELLNQMRKEVEISRPVAAYTDTYENEEEVHADRPGMRRRDWMDNAGPSSPPGNRHSEEEEEEEQSPPTPPPRIVNPYSARRGERRNSPNLPPTQPGRLPSRAAVLRNSTSRSNPSPEPINPQPEIKSPPTRLEAFLASNTPILPIAESSTSPRSRNILSRRDSGSSTSSSRKGKDRAISPLPVPEAQISNTTSASVRRNRFRQTPPPDSDIDERPASRKRPQTPRRISVDLAPEDISSFARNAGGLEVRGEVELDLDEGLSAVGWEESSQEESLEIPLRSGNTSMSPERRERSRTVQHRTSPIIQQEGNLRSSLRHPQNRHSPTSLQEPNLQHSQRRYSSDSPEKHDTPPKPRPSRYNSQSTPSPPLPALPEPDISAQSDTSEVDTYSSRRAALFRSTSRSASASTSTSTMKSGSQTPSLSYGTATGLRSRLSNRSSMERERSEEVSEGDILPRRSPLNKARTSPQAQNTEKTQERSTPQAQIPPAQTSPVHQDVPSRRKGYTPPRKVEDISIPAQDPIQVNIAQNPPPPSLPSNSNLNSTPSKSLNPNVSTLPTPKPPGAWQSTPKPKVRFNPSPLSRYSPTRPETPSREGVEEGEGVSIHRLRVSPRRSPKITMKEKEVGEGEEVGNGSFLGRLAGSLSSPLKRSRLSIPPKSTTFSLHTPSLEQAKSATTLAEQNLLITQKQWLEALSAINAAASTSGKVVRKGWGWGTWALWGLVEILILWSVFRMTIDYATSLTHISTLDPFHPLSLPFRQTSTSTWSNGPFGSISLEIPIPSALQTLVGGTRGNVNFFDLIESWGVWSKVGSAANGGGRMLGGVGSGGVPS